MRIEPGDRVETVDIMAADSLEPIATKVVRCYHSRTVDVDVSGELIARLCLVCDATLYL